MKKESTLKSNLRELAGERNFKKVFIRSMHCLFIKNNNYGYLVFIQILLIPIIIIQVIGNNTFNSVYFMINLFFDLIVALFGVFFTGYAIFQAFMSKRLIITLLSNNGDKRSLFNEYNLFFFSMCILYLTIALLDVIILLYLDNYYDIKLIINLNHLFNDFIKFILLNIIIGIHIFAFVEIKSLIFNIYQSFNTIALIAGLDELNNKRDDE